MVFILSKKSPKNVHSQDGDYFLTQNRYHFLDLIKMNSNIYYVSIWSSISIIKDQNGQFCRKLPKW